MRPQGKADTKNAVATLQAAFGIDASSHTPRGVHDIDPTTFDLVVSIDDHRTNRIANAVRTVGIPPEQHVAWTINGPWGGDHTEYEASALAIVKALAQLRKRIAQAEPSA